MTTPRYRIALDYIHQAQSLIDPAAQELCPLEGLADEWRETCALYRAIQDHWFAVEYRARSLLHRQRQLSRDDSAME